MYGLRNLSQKRYNHVNVNHSRMRIMDEDLVLLQGKLNDISVQLENFVPTSDNALQLRQELNQVLSLLNDIRLKNQQTA